MIYRRRACVGRLAGRSQQNCSCSEADDTCRDSRAEIIIVFVSVMISIIVSLVMVVAATVVTPTVARAGFSSREGRQRRAPVRAAATRRLLMVFIGFLQRQALFSIGAVSDGETIA